MNSCHDFRTRLGAALEGRLDGAPLAWHEHLFSCADCRNLFEAEEALEMLLACLPEPKLPVALTQRVLRRLARDRDLERNLDVTIARALELGDDGVPPANLTERVLRGLEAQDPVALDALLDQLPTPEVPAELAARVLRGLETTTLDELLSRLPEPVVPAGLSARVLTGLSRETVAPAPTAQAPILRPTFGRWRRSAAVAALLLALFGGYRFLRPDGALVHQDEPVRVASHQDEPLSAGQSPGATVLTELPDPELLAALDLLEDWDLLVPSDADLLLGSLDESETELLLLDLTTDVVPEDEESEG